MGSIGYSFIHFFPVPEAAVDLVMMGVMVMVSF
jgi:hypothetical protein